MGKPEISSYGIKYFKPKDVNKISLVLGLNFIKCSELDKNFC
jgi:hypothetical protein